jgi:hypothetical protein
MSYVQAVVQVFSRTNAHEMTACRAARVWELRYRTAADRRCGIALHFA